MRRLAQRKNLLWITARQNSEGFRVFDIGIFYRKVVGEIGTLNNQSVSVQDGFEKTDECIEFGFSGASFEGDGHDASVRKVILDKRQDGLNAVLSIEKPRCRNVWQLCKLFDQ